MKLGPQMVEVCQLKPIFAYLYNFPFAGHFCPNSCPVEQSSRVKGAKTVGRIVDDLSHLIPLGYSLSFVGGYEC